MSRTVELIQQEQDAILAAADERPEDERSLTSEEVETYEALEKERQDVLRTAHIRSLHAAARTFSGAPAVIGAQAKGDKAQEVAFDHYLRTGVPNSGRTSGRRRGRSGTTRGRACSISARSPSPRSKVRTRCFTHVASSRVPVSWSGHVPASWRSHDEDGGTDPAGAGRDPRRRR